jgi:Reverse transcriptase (RNA-dependent DNA polymerase)/Endonuclease-reverse transcriptase
MKRTQNITNRPKTTPKTTPTTTSTTKEQNSLLHEVQVPKRISTDPLLSVSNLKMVSQELKIENPKMKIGLLNVGSLTGKAQRLEELMVELDIDLLFLSETWTAEGQAKRYCPSIAHALEHKRTRIHGHVPYGQAIMVQKNKCRPGDLTIVEDDPTEDKSYSVIQFKGVVFVCLYAAPSRSAEWFANKLESCAARGLSDLPVILMGDLNARHVSFDDHNSNTYGNVLLAEMESYGFQRIKPVQGRWTFLKANARSIVDHVLANDAAAATVTNLTVHENLYVGGTEHRLLTFDSPIITEPATVPACPRPWNRARLKDAKVQEELDQYCQAGLPRLMAKIYELSDASVDHLATIDQMDTIILEWLNDGLKAKVGLAPQRKPGWASTFMTRDLLASLSIVEHHFDHWSANKDSPFESLRLYGVYESHRKAHLKLVADRKSSMYKEFAEKVQDLSRSEQVRLVASLRRNKARSNGALLRTDSSSLESYGRHYASQFVNTQPVVPTSTDSDEVRTPTEDLGPFEYYRISLGIKNLANGKASGISGIFAEVLKAINETVAEPLYELFSFCLQHKVVPTSWCRARIHPVPKKGDLTKIANYRPISLTEVPRKLFESLLLQSVRKHVEPLAVEQGGFRTSRGTLDQIATLQEWICQCKAVKAERFMAFLDIKAAYDQVDRTLLWESCKKKGLPSDLIQMLRALFDNNMARIGINGSESEEFPIQSGVLQGSLLSPLLYSVFINDLAEALNASGIKSGISIGGRLYRLLLYADDIVLMANSKSSLQKMLLICENHSEAKRYRFNVSKCEVVASAPGNFTLYAEPLPRSDSFTYLGCPFTKNGIDWEGHFRRMGAKATTAADSLCQSGINGRGLGISVALPIFRTFIRPVLEYSLALCPKNKIAKLKPAYGRALSWLASAGKGASSDVIGLFGGLEPLNARWERLSYRFLNKVISREPAKTGVFAVMDAFKSHGSKKVPGSVFSTKDENPMCKEWIRLRNRARFEKRAVPRDESDKAWKVRKEELMQAVPAEFQTGFIFGSLDSTSRPRALRAYSSLEPPLQHAILLWCLNRATGHWKVCRGCQQAEAMKMHVEACILGLDGVSGGPSLLEDKIFDNMCNASVLRSAAQDIILCIGDRPTSNNIESEDTSPQ